MYSKFRVGSSKAAVPFILKNTNKLSVDGIKQLVKINKMMLGYHFNQVFKQDFESSEFVPNNPMTEQSLYKDQFFKLQKLSSEVKVGQSLLKKRKIYLESISQRLSKQIKQIDIPLTNADYMNKHDYVRIDTDKIILFYQSVLTYRLNQL